MARRNLFKLFVGNLPWTISRYELSEYFSQFGKVSNSFVHFNAVTGLSKGYGFVAFDNKNGMDAALSQRNHELEGSKLTVNASSKLKKFDQDEPLS